MLRLGHTVAFYGKQMTYERPRSGVRIGNATVRRGRHRLALGAEVEGEDGQAGGDAFMGRVGKGLGPDRGDQPAVDAVMFGKIGDVGMVIGAVDPDRVMGVGWVHRPDHHDAKPVARMGGKISQDFCALGPADRAQNADGRSPAGPDGDLAGQGRGLVRFQRHPVGQIGPDPQHQITG